MSDDASAEHVPPRGRRVVLGICGSIAAYKGADLCSKLVQAGHDVTVVMTDAATKLVGPLTFAALSGRAVATDPYTGDEGMRIEHIGLADRAQILIVAPATANFLAKAAHGIADDVLLSSLLAMTCPVLVAPAMNVRMWEHRATQQNLARCRDLGYEIVAPGDGFLACGDVGTGRMAEPDAIMQRAAALLGA